MRRLVRSLAVSAMVLLSACESTGPRPASVEGTWSYEVKGLSSGRTVCEISGVTLQITQMGSTFSGTTSGGRTDCVEAGGSPVSHPVGALEIVNGTISGSAIAFDFGDASVRHQGSLSGNRMAGTLTLRDGGLVSATGSFTAERR